MKTIFDPTAREELMERISTLTQQNTAAWGKMNISQMIKHCVLWNDWVLGRSEQQYKQILLGKIFGKMALKNLVKNDKPMGKNAPAGNFTVKEASGDVEPQKKIWMEQIAAYGQFSNSGFIHDFFGKMKDEEIGIFVYKHMDHHLRHFNA